MAAMESATTAAAGAQRQHEAPHKRNSSGVVSIVVNASEPQDRLPEQFSRAFDHRATPGKSVAACLDGPELEVMQCYRERHGLKLKDRWNVSEIPNSSGTEKQLLYNFREKIIASHLADTEDKQSFCSDVTMLRYLRARGLKLEKAMCMLEATLAWRAKTSPSLATSPESGRDSSLTDARILGMDKLHRPVIFQSYVGSKDRSSAALELHNICVMEKAMQCMSANTLHSVVFIYDLGANQKDGLSHLKDHAKMTKAVKGVARVFQDHYPEMLSLMVFINPPAVYEAAFQMAKRFIDPQTAKKVMILHENRLEDKLVDVVGPRMASQISKTQRG